MGAIETPRSPPVLVDAAMRRRIAITITSANSPSIALTIEVPGA